MGRQKVNQSSSKYNEQEPIYKVGLDTLKINGYKSRSKRHEEFLDSMYRNTVTVALGPAGTGKTHTTVFGGLKLLKDLLVEKIILVRPTVEAAETLGYLPGNIERKLDPYMMPFLDEMELLVGKHVVDDLYDDAIVDFAAINFMRGRTLRNSLIAIDEVQNATPHQLMTLLTRIGEGSKMVITGDPAQSDLPPEKQGAIDMLHKLNGVPGVGFVQLDRSNIMRPKIVADILKALKQEDYNG